MFSLAFLRLLLLPYLVWAQTTYLLDNTNLTAWTFDRGSYASVTSGSASHACQSQLAPCTGSLMFRGSSVEVFGVSFKVVGGTGTRHCQIDFNWPSGNQSYKWVEDSSIHSNVSFVKVGGFIPSEVSYLSFRQDVECGGLDYAVVTVEDTVSSTGLVPSSTSTARPVSTKSKPPIGAIVGGTVGGVSAVLLVVALVVWRRHRKLQQADQVDRITHTPEPGMDVTTPPLNSLAQSAREKQTRSIEPKTAERASSSVDPDVHPAVQARLQQLEEAIEDIRRSQGPSAPPPAY
ncbi:hypothetical protein DL96DRAFT_1762210 [Flagelloscypha sp. PMI_526]|nr:hypothetical protein DL96DRAFT_1762210 [Flagelloscypha sp. PMI_526]